jgi:uncharacterized protein YlxW (UPF0749 family)
VKESGVPLPQILMFGAQTMAEEALENLTREEDVLAEEAPETEVVELPHNIQRLQNKQARLNQEISVYQAQIAEIAEKLETAQLAFQQCVVLMQVEEAQSE